MMLDDLLLESASQLVVTLTADAKEFDFFALIHQRQRALAGKTNDGGVERAGKTALTGTDQQQMHLILAGTGQQHRRAGRTHGSVRNAGNDRVHLFRIGPRRFGGVLRAAQLRGCDHLHGLGDLLRRLGGGDADPHVFQAGHCG